MDGTAQPAVRNYMCSAHMPVCRPLTVRAPAAPLCRLRPHRRLLETHQVQQQPQPLQGRRRQRRPQQQRRYQRRPQQHQHQQRQQRQPPLRQRPQPQELWRRLQRRRRHRRRLLLQPSEHLLRSRKRSSRLHPRPQARRMLPSPQLPPRHQRS